MDFERTFFEVPALRAVDPGDPADGAAMPTIVGYAAVFNSLSLDMYGFREMVAPGAFAESLAKDDIRALWCHDRKLVLGRTKNGTLKLQEDETGLRVEFTPPDTQYARDYVAAIRRGDVDQMSFGFQVLMYDITENEEQFIRVLTKVKLYEVSPETFAAYPATSVSVRSDGQPHELYGYKPTIDQLRLQAQLGEKGTGVAARARRASQRTREIDYQFLK